MGANYLPGREADLYNWAVSFSSQLTATPTAFGITAPQAAALAPKVTAFGDLIAECSNPSTRTPGKVSGKLSARRALVAAIRPLVRIIQAFPGLTLEQRRDLGINLRDNAGRPINPPAQPPVVEVESAVGHTLTIRVHAAGGERRAKPAGAQGCTLFTFVGATPSGNPEDWACQGQSTRTKFVLQMPPTVPAGSSVWLSAVWYSPRGTYTAMSNPIQAYIAGGVSADTATQSFSEAGEPAQLKAA